MSTDPWSLSTTAASNTTIGGVSAAEGILPANLNNLDRALAAGLAELVYVAGGGIAAGGTADAITVTTGLSWASYAAGKWVAFRATATNTGATTLAVDGLSAKAVTDNTDTALVAGNITSGGVYLCHYQASADKFRLINPSVSTSTSVTASATMTDNAIVRGDGGSRGVQTSVVIIDDTTGSLYPATTDSGSLGTTSKNWSDLFLDSGAVIDFDSGDVTVTHSANTLAFAGASSGYTFSFTVSPSSNDAGALGTTSLGWSDLHLATGALINFANSNAVITHSSGVINVSTGTLQQGGSAVKKVGKETVWVPASAMISRTTNGAASGSTEMGTNKNMFKTLDFDTTTQEFAQFEIGFPKSWNLSTVTFQPVLSHASGSGNVVFGLAGVARSNDDAGDVAFGTAQTSDRTVGTANDIYIGPESSAITIAGTPAAGDTVQFQINRTVASDNLGVDARLHGCWVYFTTNAADDT